MQRITVIGCYDLSQSSEDELETRIITDEQVLSGDWTWMNPDTKTEDWQVISVHTYKPDGFSEPAIVYMATVVKGGQIPEKPECCGIADSEFPNMTKTIYLLDGEVYTYSVCSRDKPPKVGAFDEYEPYGNRRLPDTKQIDSYQTYTSVLGAPYPKIYVANMSHIKQPVAA